MPGTQKVTNFVKKNWKKIGVVLGTGAAVLVVGALLNRASSDRQVDLLVVETASSDTNPDE